MTEVWSVDVGAVTIRFPFCRLFVATEDGRFGTDLRERREGVLGGGGGGGGGLDGGGVRAGVVGGRAGQTTPGVGVVVATPKSLESHLHLLDLEDNRGGSFLTVVAKKHLKVMEPLIMNFPNSESLSKMNIYSILNKNNETISCPKTFTIHMFQ